MEALNYKKPLLIAFYIHIVMFFVVMTAAIIAESSAVLADALDFIGDAASYMISLFALNKSIRFKSSVAIAKALVMIFGCIPILTYALLRYQDNVVPDHEIMSIAGILGMISHIVCIYYLYSFRKGDSNLLSVWICTINDLIGNALLIVASLLVMITQSIIPDILIACIIVGIAFYGACIILKQAIYELRNADEYNRINS